EWVAHLAFSTFGHQGMDSVTNEPRRRQAIEGVEGRRAHGSQRLQSLDVRKGARRCRERGLLLPRAGGGGPGWADRPGVPGEPVYALLGIAVARTAGARRGLGGRAPGRPGRGPSQRAGPRL